MKKHGVPPLSAKDREWALNVADRYERGEFHCPCGAVLTQEHPRCMTLPLSLAQRILAALESHPDLAAELRARMPK